MTACQSPHRSLGNGSMDPIAFHELIQSDECVCGCPHAAHLYGDYYDADNVKRKHQGECGQCGCQGYG